MRNKYQMYAQIVQCDNRVFFFQDNQCLMSFDPQEKRFVTKPIRVIDESPFKCLKFALYHKDAAKHVHQVESLLILTYS